MNSFITKPILSTQTIGEQLRKASLGSNLTLSSIASRLAIKESYLNAIEIGSYLDLPGEIYAVQFIKKYAHFLQMDPKKAAKQYHIEQNTQNNNTKGALDILAAKPNSIFRVKRLGKGMLLVGAASMLVYMLVIGVQLLAPPELVIATPVSYYETTDPRITVEGESHGANTVLLNGEPMVLSGEGTFSESFSFARGLHLLRITALGKLGKESTQYRVVVVRAPEEGNLVLNNN